MKGFRQFTITLAGLVVYAIIAGSDTTHSLNLLQLGIGIALLVTPNAAKDIMQAFAEVKGK